MANKKKLRLEPNAFSYIDGGMQNIQIKFVSLLVITNISSNLSKIKVLAEVYMLTVTVSIL